MTKQALERPQQEVTLPSDIVAFCSLVARIVYRNIMERHAHIPTEKDQVAAEQPELPMHQKQMQPDSSDGRRNSMHISTFHLGGNIVHEKSGKEDANLK
jgi:hypothetical protein